MLREFEYSSQASCYQASKLPDYDLDYRQAELELSTPASYNDDTTLRAEERQWYLQNRESFHNSQITSEKQKTVPAETVKIEVNRRRKRNICSCECFPIIEIDTTKSSRVNMAGYDGVYGNNEDYTGGFCVNSNYTRASGAQSVIVNQVGDSAVVKTSEDAGDEVKCWGGGGGRSDGEGRDCWGSCCKSTLIAVLLIFMLVVFGLVAGLLLYNNYVNYKPRQPIPEEPCEKMYCRFGAECVTTGSGRGHCACPTSCSTEQSPVCSTSSHTYRNYCLLRKDACERKLSIRVKHNGECETADPCKEHRCAPGARCVVADGKADCRCPRSCPPRKKTVCGSDGNDYESACDLDKYACENEFNITVRYQGKCDPCSDYDCPTGSVCQLDPSRNPTCRCGPPCQFDNTPVCGSDYNSYPNECELKREACRTRTHIAIVYRGHCNSGIHPCANASCGPGEVCTLDARGVARCGCGQACEAVLKPICGSDGVAYDNSCEMERAACITNTHLRLAYEGLCGKANPCRQKSCPYGGTCIALAGHATCSCPVCESRVAPICASDLNTYGSECKMRVHSCTMALNLTVLYNDTCETCDNHRCPGNGQCERDQRSGRVSCVCPDTCPEPHESEVVCGTDGRTHPSECLLLRNACLQHTDIRVHYRGDCSLCSNINCHHGSHCSAGECVCPTDCSSALGEPVCSNTMRTYPNECELQRAACEQTPRVNMHVIFYGDCKDRLAVTVPPEALTSTYHPTNGVLIQTKAVEPSTEPATTHDDNPCKDIICDYEATCELGLDNFPKCSCKFDCPNEEYFPVCASDFNIYPSMCEMKKTTCLKRVELRLRPLELCKGLEVRPCGGGRVVIEETGREVDCGSGTRRQDCPFGTYCHQTVAAARCCYKNETSSQFDVLRKDGQLQPCAETLLGCCSDGITPIEEGCPTIVSSGCNCHRLGAMSASCDAEKRCTCRPGVGGDHCDRCESGYWGLPRIGNGHAGCIPCGCSVFGSVREDCEQMTGRCVCKPGVQGQKCTVCADHRQILGPNGCYNASSGSSSALRCTDLVCYFGAVCVEANSGAACHCPAANCPSVDSYTDTLVCGSDGKTYQSDCHLRLQACRTQEDIVVQAFGPCKSFEYQQGTTKPYSLLPFTQDDDVNSLSKSTRHLLNSDMKNKQEWHRKETQSFVVDGESTVQKAPRPTERTNSVLGPLLGDLCSTDDDCLLLPGAHCSMGGCFCKPHHVPSNHRRECLSQDLALKEISTPEYSSCLSEPCFNMGTCIDLPGSTFVCICPDLYTGFNCENVISDSDKQNIIETPSFDGEAYIRMKPLRAYHKLDIDVHFKSFGDNGILLYDQQREDGNGDFVSLAIVNGHIEFRYNLGDGTVALVSPEKIVLNDYYKISARRYHRDGILSVSGMESITGQSLGNLKALDLNEDSFFGYVPSNFSRVFENIGTRRGFVGCVKFLRVIRHQVTKRLGRPDPLVVGMNNVKDCKSNPCVSGPCKNGATCNTEKYGYSCICAPGYHGANCDKLHDPCASNPCASGEVCDHAPGGGHVCICFFGEGCSNEISAKDIDAIPQFNGSSYIELPTIENISNELRIEIWFQTHRQSGMLIYLGQSAKGKGDFVSLNLVNGFLQFCYNLGSGVANITYPQKVSKNHWHSARAWRIGRIGRLQVDNGSVEQGESGGTLTQLNLALPTYVGSIPETTKAHKLSGLTSSFVGAIQRLFINGKPMKLFSTDMPQCSSSAPSDSTPCATPGVKKYIGAPCIEDPSQCRNGGKCLPILNDYKCICKAGYQGRSCEIAPASETQNDMGPIRLDGDSYFAYRSRGGGRRKSNVDRGVRYELKFRTVNESGLLLWRRKIGIRPQDFIGLGVSNGHLQFFYTDTNTKELGIKTDWFQTLDSKRAVNDGMWHLVTIRRRKRLALMQVDDQPPIRAYTQTPLVPSKSNPKIWIGGSPTLPRGLPASMYRGFQGCVDSIKVSGKHVNIFAPIRKNKILQYCL